MAGNILRKGKDAKIIVSYIVNGKPIKHSVTIRYSDNNETYFAMPIPVDFVKPKSKTNVSITYRSSVGVLYAVTKLIDCNLSLHEIIIAVKTPKNWEDKESRRSKRKECKFPVIIKRDGYEFETESFDLSTGGISVVANEGLSNIQGQSPAEIIMHFDQDNVVTANGKFIRENEASTENGNFILHVYKFTNVSNLATLLIKKHLLSTD